MLSPGAVESRTEITIATAISLGVNYLIDPPQLTAPSCKSILFRRFVALDLDSIQTYYRLMGPGWKLLAGVVTVLQPSADHIIFVIRHNHIQEPSVVGLCS
jgi:hypothetical protein